MSTLDAVRAELRRQLGHLDQAAQHADQAVALVCFDLAERLGWPGAFGDNKYGTALDQYARIARLVRTIHDERMTMTAETDDSGNDRT